MMLVAALQLAHRLAFSGDGAQINSAWLPSWERKKKKRRSPAPSDGDEFVLAAYRSPARAEAAATAAAAAAEPRAAAAPPPPLRRRLRDNWRLAAALLLLVATAGAGLVGLDRRLAAGAAQATASAPAEVPSLQPAAEPAAGDAAAATPTSGTAAWPAAEAAAALGAASAAAAGSGADALPVALWECSAEAAASRRRARASRAAPPRVGGAPVKGARACRAGDGAAELPRLESVARLASRRRPGRAAVTLAQPAFADRLPELEAQCRQWAGLPLAAAVYLPQGPGAPPPLSSSLRGGGGAPQPALDDALAAVFALHARTEAAGAAAACALDVEVFVETLCGGGPGSAGGNGSAAPPPPPPSPPPAGALRNRALALVGTPAVLLADGGHLAASALADSLRAPLGRDPPPRAADPAWQRAQVAAALARGAGVLVPALAPRGYAPITSAVGRQAAAEAVGLPHTLVKELVKAGQYSFCVGCDPPGPAGAAPPPGRNRTAAAEAWASWSEKLPSLKWAALPLRRGAAPPLLLVPTAAAPWADERLRDARAAGAAWLAAYTARLPAARRSWWVHHEGYGVGTFPEPEPPAGREARAYAAAVAAAAAGRPVVGMPGACFAEE